MFMPTLFICLFPASLIIFKLITYIGWLGIGRATQMIMIASVIGGISVGACFLWLVDEAGFDADYTRRVKWCSRLSIVLPMLWILLAFLLVKMGL